MIEVLQLLNAISDKGTALCGGYTVRHLRPNEPFPDFGHGFLDSPLLQRDWIWIAEVHGKSVATLIAAPVQGYAYMMRIFATKEAPKSVFVGLLRKSLADMYSRGYTNFLVCLTLDREEEGKLGRILKRAGGVEIGKGTMFVGETLHRY